MKRFIYTALIFLAMLAFSCQSLVEGIDENPNGITVDEVNPTLFLTGAQLANSSAGVGHLNRIAGMWSGQLVGLSSLYSNIYGYSISTAEAIGTWSRIYIGVIPNVRHIRNIAPDDPLLQGISKVLEAQAIGLGASLFGDVPYSEISNEEIPDPSFDGQVSVLNAAISLLDNALVDLASAGGRSLSQDIYFDGDADKWIAAANTLKARFYMLQRDYSNAYSAAQNGIASADGNMQHIPRGDASVSSGDKNTFWEILEGARTGDIGSEGSYLSQLLDSASSIYRGNAKTDERARGAYSFVFSTGGSDNLGIIEQFEPQNLVSYEENQLILAEAGTRTAGIATGLGHLNDFRAWLNSGGRLNDNFIDLPYRYDPYEVADFENGGIENADNIPAERALLREIIEERYVSGFGEFMPFDDARRLRKDDNDLSVPFPLNTSGATAYPERMPYSDDELNSNSNAPAEDPGIFTKTAVNQ
ncbi:MAG: SusD/RagB family nutrient-binding outer membrane lipoprotein [Bacteroidota bacterium]